MDLSNYIAEVTVLDVITPKYKEPNPSERGTDWIDKT